MNLIERISKEMDEDTDNLTKQSDLLADTYRNADDAGKALLDEAFACLCGWSLKTLLERADKNDDTDTEDEEELCGECGQGPDGAQSDQHAQFCSLHPANEEKR